jgi:superfamily II DNA or RNA helicase
MKLREYQEEALVALERDWATGFRRCGVNAATGTGKTVIMSHLAHRYARRGLRVLILVHRDELVRQTVDKLVRIDNSVSIGIVKAGENSAGAAIVVASVQTACRPRRLAQLGRFGLIICDEAHRSVSDQWLTVLSGLGALEEGTQVRCAGFSATWVRADTRGLDKVWETISFSLPIEWAIAQGFLVRPIGKYIRTDIQLDGVRKTAGEYNAADLGEKLSRESVRDAIVAGYLTHAHDRSGVVFAPTVDAGQYFREGFEAAGIATGGLYGVTSREDSKLLHKQHRRGDVQVLVSCVKLSEGWDAPWVSAGVIARPTVHEGLFIQMVGRLLRIHEGKQDAIILDPTGVLFRHSLNGVIDLTSSERPPKDDDPDEEGDEYEDDEPAEVDPDAGIRARVSGYEDVELIKSDLPWLVTRGGIVFSHHRDGVAFVAGPDQHGQPWYSVGYWPLNGGRPSWLATRLTMHEAYRLLPDRRSTPAPALRRRPATNKQRMRAMATLGRRPRNSQTAGELFDAVQVELASRALDAVQSWT